MAAFAVLLAGFSSCDTSGRQHRGGGLEPEVPVRPGEGSETTNDVTFTDAFGEYYGTYYSDITDNFLVYLSEGAKDNDGYFTGSGKELILDIILPRTGDKKLREGVYSCSDASGRTFIFVPSYDNKNEAGKTIIDGSLYRVQRDAQHYEEYRITDGKLEIKSYVTGQLGIEATIVAGGVEYTFHFKGNIPVEDKTIQPVDDTFPGSDIYPLKAKALYNGEIYEGSDDYSLFLYYGEYADNGDFKTVGSETVFDVLATKNGGKGIAAGTYTCTGDNFTPFHVLEGLEQDGTVYPSYLYRQYDNKGDYSLELITAATVEVSGPASNCRIKAYFQTASGSFACEYEGPLEIVDNSGEPSGDVPKNVEMKNITRVVAEDWGKVWDDIECTDYRDWILYFYDKDASTTKEYTCVEILTEEKYSGSLPEMKFSKVIAPEKNKTTEFVPGVIIGGFSDKDSNAWGTWYCKGGTAWYAASKGNLDIKRDGDGYNLSFDFVDEDETYGGTFKGSYKGKVEFTKAQTSSSAALRSAGKALEPQRGAALRRAAAPARSAGAAGRKAGVRAPAAAPSGAQAPATRSNSLPKAG